jgi:hypothetical protein
MFVNGTRVAANENIPWHDESGRGFTEAYLLGWSNSGFDETTDMFIDDFKFYTTNPGW